MSNDKKTFQQTMKSGPISLREEFGLSWGEMMFVTEYVKDNATQRAAEAAGYTRDYGATLKEKPQVKDAIEHILTQRMESNLVDADTLMKEMWDNHKLARQMGNLAASNQALNQLAKHKRVDAFAAEKIKVSTDADVVDRLAAARKRVRDDKDDNKPLDSGDTVSFMSS